MNPSKVSREKTEKLTDLPNVGKSIAEDLRRIGIMQPEDLIGRDAYALYEALNKKSGMRLDPCLLDVMMSVVDFMNGGEAKVWWAYTPERKIFLKHLEL